MGPIGGIVFRHIGDRFGPTKAMFTSAVVMTLSTFACLPTTTRRVASAHLSLVRLRLGQGMSVGGEHTASAAFLVTGSAPERHGLMGSLIPLEAMSGIMVRSLTGVVIPDLRTPDEVEA